MIPTDKYKKGVIALTQKAAELNPLLGRYEIHYLNERGRFIIQLTNGQLEVDIDMARDFEQNAAVLHEDKLQQVAFSYKDEDKVYKANATVDTAWKKLFAVEKRKISE